MHFTETSTTGGGRREDMRWLSFKVSGSWKPRGEVTVYSYATSNFLLSVKQLQTEWLSRTLKCSHNHLYFGFLTYSLHKCDCMQTDTNKCQENLCYDFKTVSLAWWPVILLKSTLMLACFKKKKKRRRKCWIMNSLAHMIASCKGVPSNSELKITSTCSEVHPMPV